MRLVAIIPARMASSRLPGKPLLRIHGLEMVEHVRRRVLLSQRFSEVVVATCDREIADLVERYGGKSLMTSPTHPGALDRVAEAMEYLDCTHVVNVQGDQILVLPEDLEAIVAAMGVEPGASAWNGAARIEDPGDLANPSIVKLILSKSKRILFCTRVLKSVPLGEPFLNSVRLSVGVMGYSRNFLKRYQSMDRTPLETADSIDHLRILEHDETIRAVDFSKWYPDVNEPREVELVERYLSKDPRQQAILEQILS